MAQTKEKINFGTVENVQSVPYLTIESMPISLRVVVMYAMLVSKKYMNLKTFSWGEKSTTEYAGWGISGYYEMVSSILSNKHIIIGDSVINGINASGYDISYVKKLLNEFEIISTTVLVRQKNPVKNPTIKAMKTMTGVVDANNSGRKLSTKDVPYSTILLKDIDVDYCLKELYSILPKEVVNALQDREAIKLVLGNQTEEKRPEIVANYQSTIGVQKPNTLIHKPNN